MARLDDLERSELSVSMVKDLISGRPTSLLRELRPPECADVIVEPPPKVVKKIKQILEKHETENPLDPLPPDVEALIADFSLNAAKRPAIFISGDSYVTPYPRWKLLNQRRRLFERAIRAVGRVEYDVSGRQVALGTAFVVAPEVVITNRHVIDRISSDSAKSRMLKPGLHARVDFNEENGATVSRQHEMVEILSFPSGRLDYCTVRISRHDQAGRLMPEPLQISSKRPRKDDVVAAIGYPARPSLEGTKLKADQITTLFANKFGVKRISPGRVLSSSAPIFEHDCTTLGGSSGSCILDSNGDVLGLHYDGEALKANFAINMQVLSRLHLALKA